MPKFLAKVSLFNIKECLEKKKLEPKSKIKENCQILLTFLKISEIVSLAKAFIIEEFGPLENVAIFLGYFLRFFFASIHKKLAKWQNFPQTGHTGGPSVARPRHIAERGNWKNKSLGSYVTTDTRYF